jgi:peroxiredoxin
MRLSPLSILFTFAFLLMTLSSAKSQTVHNSAYETGVPSIGDLVPNVDLIGTEGSTYSLKNIIEGKKTILVLYRGGWCPYCTSQMSGLAKVQKEISAQGYQIIGITGEDLGLTGKFSESHNLPYKVFTDKGIILAKKLSVAYKVDDATLNKYKGYGIEIADGILPVPTLLVLNTNGIIEYVYAEPDYKVRLSTEELMNKLNSIKEASAKE